MAEELRDQDEHDLEERTGPPPRFDRERSILWLGGVPIPFRPGEQGNDALLAALASTLRELRGLRDDGPCPLRRSDDRLLADLLDLDDPGLRTRIRDHLGLTRREAGDTVMRLRLASVDSDLTPV